MLGRQYDARLTGATGFGNTLEIMNQGIARVGARFTFQGQRIGSPSNAVDDQGGLT